MRVLIEAQIEPGIYGGIEQFLIGLLKGLGQFKDSNEEYIIISHWKYPDLLRPYLAANQRIIPAPRPKQEKLEWMKIILGPLRKPLGVCFRRMQYFINGASKQHIYSVPTSNGFYEGLSGDVLHITYPPNYLTSQLPTIFTIYDLQHRHFPQFFPGGDINMREVLYAKAFDESKIVTAVSEWVREDVIQQYGVDPEKIFYVPSAAPTESYEKLSSPDLLRTKHKFSLPEHFMLYPALTYEHKNHIGLLDAIVLLRDTHNTKINLICTGQQHLHWPKIKEHLKELKLGNQVRFLGFIRPGEVRALYHLADFLIFPSLFEGVGLPLLEAFKEGTPVACSDIPAFREYGKDAAFFFNPNSIEDMAKAILRMFSDNELRTNLQKKGQERISHYSWEKTAKAYHALYRKMAGKNLTEEDQAFICTQKIS